MLGPTGLTFRPTTGRVKEFIFSYLGDEVEGARILDLFSGTGSLGVEALSRGARRVVFLEQNRKHLDILTRNIETCGVQARARTVRGDVFKELGRMGDRGEVFDIILADPPFRETWRERIGNVVSESNVLSEDGILIIEHEYHDSDSGAHELRLIRQRRFGHCVVSVYAEEA